MKKFDKYFKAIGFLEGLYNLPLGKDYLSDHKNPEIYLRRMNYLLELLGRPERGLKYIHITGTSGKGSVASAVHLGLVKAGKKAGLFTSPFVTTSIEKIKVGEKYIAPDELAKIVEELKPIIDKAFREGPDGGPSYFEIFTAIAFLYFKKTKCEWAVLEVGMGGRYDSTNVIQKTLITAITNINYDHTHILGKTLSRIARDKAGIIKRGSQFFTTEARPALLDIFREECQKTGSKFNLVPAVAKDYLLTNAALVRAILGATGIQNKFVAAGIKESRLPCRFEIVQKKPLVVLDGAHNESKMESTVENLEKLKYRKLFLVLAAAENKDIDSILKVIAPKADYALATRFEIKERKCRNPFTLAEQIKKYKKIPVEVYLDPWQALSKAFKLAKPEDLILATGSFFLTGELRQKWYPEEWILERRESF
ncbi:MAG: Mur ligase family protein [Candidatus Paceibacterota bacterium]|jgi:dihydrofolate synthase/folylpolyglutamate synthase